MEMMHSPMANGIARPSSIASSIRKLRSNARASTEGRSRSPSPSSSTHSSPLVASPARGLPRARADNGDETETFLVADVRALRYLRGPDKDCVNRLQDGSIKTTVITGFEVYLVEQWACARSFNSTIICYTGNPEHRITVGSITVPKNRNLWSSRIQAFVDELGQMNAMPKPYAKVGILFVTNLSSFPSGLTLINVPDGDVWRHQDDFIVKENLRRMGCGGRAAITLNKPADASRDKFYQIYRVSDRVPFHDAVIDLVILIQISLHYFGLFRRYDIDGLLCDVTEKAINSWWHDIGSSHYRVEIADNILGPTTVAAILGMVVGCRHRLNAAVAQVPRDPFDLEAFKTAIDTFQRSMKLSKTTKLDRATREKLFKITGKISASERFPLTKVVKSTVQDISGIHTHNAVDVETTDYDRFIENIYGKSLRYLYLGKLAKEFALSSRGTKFANLSEERSQSEKHSATLLAPSAIPASTLSNSYNPPRRPKQQKYNGAQAVAAPSDDGNSLHHSSTVASSTADVGLDGDDYNEYNDAQDNENFEADARSVGTDDGTQYSRQFMEEVPAYVRYRRERRRAQEDGVVSSRKDIKDAMRRGKVKTDEAFRKVNKLADNLRPSRHRGERNTGVTGHKHADHDNTPLSAGTSTAPSTATDVSGKGGEELEHAEDDDLLDDDDQGYEEDNEDADSVSAATRQRKLSRDRTIQDRRARSVAASASSRPESEYGMDGSVSGSEPVPDPQALKDVGILRAIETSLRAYASSAGVHRLRNVKSCADLDLLRLESEQPAAPKVPGDKEYSPRIVRRASLSVAEATIFRWDLPTDHPIEYIFKLLDRVKNMEEWSSARIKEAEDLRNGYDLQLTDVSKFHSQALAESESIHQTYQHAVQRELYLAKGVRDLDMEAARLQYELRTLDAKLDDLDESIDSLGAKIVGMESRVASLRPKSQRSSL